MSAWAAVVERLIAAGHEDPMSYTPEQAVAFAELADRRRKRELLDLYQTMKTAAGVGFGGSKEADEAMIRSLTED